MLSANNIIKSINLDNKIDQNDYRDYRAAILAGYFDRITEVNPEEVIKTFEVSILLKWIIS